MESGNQINDRRLGNIFKRIDEGELKMRENGAGRKKNKDGVYRCDVG
jgi:hypothetical protein